MSRNASGSAERTHMQLLYRRWSAEATSTSEAVVPALFCGDRRKSRHALFDCKSTHPQHLLILLLLACSICIRPPPSPPSLPLLSAMSGAQKSAINRMKAAQQANKQT